MPSPRTGESRDDFVSRCIPVVLDDGTAKDRDQAVAICNSMWDEKSMSPTPRGYDDGESPEIGTGMETKSFAPPQMEADEKGSVTAVIATFGVIDKDNDITAKGAFGEQLVPMVYGHKWDGIPIGKGRIYEDGETAVFDGQFNLNTSTGRDAYESVKFQGELQEWSYGYSVKDSQRITHEGKSARLIKSTKAHEVSPVLIGAGVGTRTTAVKGDEGLRFVEQAGLVVAALGQLGERAKAIAELREGKLGAESMELLIKAYEEGKTVMETLALLVEKKGAEDEGVDLHAEFLRFQKFIHDQRGLMLS